MLVHLAMTLSAVDGWGLPWDNQTSSLSSNESAITGGADGAHDQRQLQGFWDRFDGKPGFRKIDPSAEILCTANCDECGDHFFGHGYNCDYGCDHLGCMMAEGGSSCDHNCNGFWGIGGCLDDCDTGCNRPIHSACRASDLTLEQNPQYSVLRSASQEHC